ncbi:tagaturonate reductase [Thermanaeromonas toyohensis ToBE]|uniref:Tagaturonate reductase n=1 Tax=Thermanaeromonas toyohensis ToBE TaxID=698762 RepID=A0A1W1VEE8_9FIRM|nr:tagaturonate reductase [Thermanaeromonas toyohensis]SMB91593.1 tagaturonate reductase [Thermanaeromonas toyohensis ToBE]
MQPLNKILLRKGFPFPSNLEVSEYPEGLPERVIQFGEGNFLRAFVDWMFHRLNKEGLFNGRVVVVQPLPQGLVDKLNEQDGLYTLLLYGYQEGKLVEKREIIGSISRALNSYTQWEEVLACATNPDLEFIISNTTEAGIAYDPEDRLELNPPRSFPGKITAFLYRRFQHFQGDPPKGMILLPCELIDRNGDNLKRIVLQLAQDWGLPVEFREWVDQYNLFLNTLVDRVVPGYPRDRAEMLAQELGYRDDLMVVGELFHLWVIEGPEEIKEKLPFHRAGLNVIWTSDLTPYRTRKVRILNGIHTATAAPAFLAGVDTVREAVEHPVWGSFMKEAIFEEIIPSMDLDMEMLKEFAREVLERFRNPYIIHYWQSILLNTTSKYQTRVLPSILGYLERKGALPLRLVFSLAALAYLFKEGKISGRKFYGQRLKGEFTLEDDPKALAFWQEAWEKYQGTEGSLCEVARFILRRSDIWGQDLTPLPGLVDLLARYLGIIMSRGTEAALAAFLG